MKKNEILEEIESNGGFCNLNNWNKKELAEWVYHNYNCSKYVAKQVAKEL